ncbi:hypothetical protein, partial [Thiolapillus sp.]
EPKPLQEKKSPEQECIKEKPYVTVCCIKKKWSSVRRCTSSIPIFANGALSGAFGYLFNQAAHNYSDNINGADVIGTEPNLIKDIGALIDDPGRYFSCSLDCAKEIFDPGVGVKSSVAASGINMIPTRRKPGGTTKRTSLASKLSRSIFGKRRLPKPYPAPTQRLGISAKTIKVGTFAGRWIPILGTASLLPDARSMDYCVASCIRPGE